MRIEGDITVDDYIRSARVHTTVVPPWLRVVRVLHYSVIFASAYAIGDAIAGDRGARMCLFCVSIPFISHWCVNALCRQPLLAY